MARKTREYFLLEIQTQCGELFDDPAGVGVDSNDLKQFTKEQLEIIAIVAECAYITGWEENKCF